MSIDMLGNRRRGARKENIRLMFILFCSHSAIVNGTGGFCDEPFNKGLLSSMQCWMLFIVVMPLS